MSDGLLLSSLTALESEVEALEDLKFCYVQGDKQPVLPVGPLLPPIFLSTIPTSDISSLGDSKVKGFTQTETETRDECLAFLDAAFDKYGQHSALYILFGTVIVPSVEQLEYLRCPAEAGRTNAFHHVYGKCRQSCGAAGRASREAKQEWLWCNGSICASTGTSLSSSLRLGPDPWRC